MKKLTLIITVIVSLAYINAICATEKPEAVRPITMLTANVGNADVFNCGREYIFKLCLIKVEERVGEEIKKLNPDLVALQEVYDDEQCAKKKEKNSKRICSRYGKIKPEQQARRLLGDEYTIVCDGRANFECIGLKKEIGRIEGCAEGSLCKGRPAAITIPAPDGCEEFPVIFGVNAEIFGKKVRVINAHPAASKADCRAADVKALFDGTEAVEVLAAPALNVLAMGDFNLDPFTEFSDNSIEAMRAGVGEGRGFYYLSGPAENKPPLPTSAGRTIDHVFTNFAMGKCTTLGMVEGTVRLDGTSGDNVNPEGTDHSQVFCTIDLFPPAR